jgi:hypothetical protein
MTTPAAPIAQLNHDVAEIDPGRSSPTASVRYTENTNVRITALKAADPQSQIPQANTCFRVVATPTTAVSAGVFMGKA